MSKKKTFRKTRTPRGFGIRYFKDHNDVECSIQTSSIASDDAIWLGATEIGLKEFIAYRSPSAWKNIELEQTVTHHHVANTRMHLTRKQVEKILPILEKFVETGDI